MATVVLLGTLDTKGVEYDYLRARVQAAGCDVILVDVGVLAAPLAQADVPREQVAAAAGAITAALAAAQDRGAAMEAMAQGAAKIALDLFNAGRLHGVLSMGGSGNSSVASRAMQALPLGVPKLMVSTVASGDTRPYVGASDIAMLYSVVDISGINSVSERILTNAANAIAGMAQGYVDFQPASTAKPLVTATMFGVTTPAVTEARQQLEQLGYEVLVFHATGTGGRAMETLVASGFVVGVFDLTTTELADELVGGTLSAGPERLEAAGRQSIPQVVSLGALDMVNFGPFETVPEQFKGRTFYKHNATITLMRTTPQENAELGRMIAHKLSAAHGPVALFIPLRGVSAIDVEGGVFYDPAADIALIETLKANLGANVELHELDMDINDPRFAQAMAARLHELIHTQAKSQN